MRPISLEIVSRVMTSFGHCRHCTLLFNESGLQEGFNQKILEDYPQDLIEEFARLSEWVRELSRLYKHRLLIRLIDAQSLLGMYKCLRHRIRTYPAFIIEGRETFIGWDRNRLEELLDRYIQASILQRNRSAHSATV